MVPAAECTAILICCVEWGFDDFLPFGPEYLGQFRQCVSDNDCLLVQNQSVTAEPRVGVLVGDVDEFPILENVRESVCECFPADQGQTLARSRKAAVEVQELPGQLDLVDSVGISEILLQPFDAD